MVVAIPFFLLIYFDSIIVVMPDSIAKYTSIESVILTVLALIVIVIFAWSIYAFVRSIWLFIFSHGESEKIKSARNSIRYMILGILLTLVLLFIFPFLFETLGVNGYEVYTAKNIFARAGEILSSTLDFGKDAADNYNGWSSASPSGGGSTNYEL